MSRFPLDFDFLRHLLRTLRRHRSAFWASLKTALKKPNHRVRRLAPASALVGALLAVGIVSAFLAREGRPRPPAFDLKGWEYRQIVPAASADRYRLRVDVARSPDEPSGTAEPGDIEVPHKGAARRHTTARTNGSEFRLLLERRDQSNFVCLRWLDGRLELLRLSGGRRAELLGRTSHALPHLMRPRRATLLKEPDAARPRRATLLKEPDAAPGPASATVYIDRSPGLWAVSSLGRELITAGDPEALPRLSADEEAGDGKAPDFAWGATSEWTLAARAFQPIEAIRFDDGFADEGFNKNGSYEILSGTWELDSGKDASRSVNSFRLRGASGRQEDGAAVPAVAVLGSRFWRLYRVEASIRLHDPGAGGLVFARSSSPRPLKVTKAAASSAPARPPSRFGLLRWRLPGPRGGGEDAGARPVPSLEVVEVREQKGAAPGASGWGGAYEERVVFSLPWTPRRDQWYRVAVSLFAEFGEIEVNGRRAEFPLPAGLRAGACGLYAESKKGVLFDDVRVVSHGGFLFRPGAEIAPWIESSRGTRQLYRLPAGAARLRFALAPETPSLRLAWKDRSGGTVSVGLDRERLRGEILRTGRATPASVPHHAAEFDLGRPPAVSAAPMTSADEFTVEIGQGECAVLRGETVLARASLESARDGPVLVESRSGGVVPFARLAGGPVLPRAALRQKSKAFSKVDITIHNNEDVAEHKWAQFAAWLEDRGTWERGEVGQRQRAAKMPGGGRFLRCRTLLWGPVEASVELDLPRRPGAGQGGTVMFALVPDEHDLEPVGVGVRGEPSGGHVIVDARGKRLAAFEPRDVGAGREPESKGGSGSAKRPKVRLALRRSGDFVEASVGGRRLCRAPMRADAPVRVEARARRVAPSDISIRAPLVDESLFDSAPVEWVRWRGHWEVTNKWQCDPRWAFLGLWSRPTGDRSEAAGAFSRASYFGDQDLQFYFTFKDMLGGHNGEQRYIRRDLNFAFACAGDDLASGYCLLLGGFGNRGTQLLRRGKLVHESKDFRLRDFTGSAGDVHWKWYRLRILRRGGAIRAIFNGEEILAWRDPEPLEGGHLGVWTLGNGMILGRTRFSAARRGEELAGFCGEDPGASALAGWRALDADRPVRTSALDAGSVKRAAKGLERAARQGSEMGPLSAVRVTNVAGGGHFAVARAGSSGESKATAFAFRARAGVRVGAYAIKASSLGCGRRAARGVRPRRIAPAGALPADGAWHVFSIEGALRSKEALVFGSFDPKDYVAAGLGANAGGASYEVVVFGVSEEGARRRAEEEARRKAEEARRKAEEETRRKAEEARRKAEAEARQKAEEARRKAEEEARRKAEEARRKAAEEARRRAEAAARRKAEEEARRKAEVARRKAEEEVRRRAEEARAFLGVKEFPPNPRGGPGGLERDHEWKAVEWGNPVELFAWRRKRPREDVLLLVRYTEGKRDKAAIKVDAGLAFARKGLLRVDVYNTTDRKIPVAFAIFTSDDRAYSESRTKPAGPGWSHLAWDLSASTYKSLGSGWRYTSTLKAREDVRELVLLFYDKKSAALAVDGIEADLRR